jgi:hypothetical protein
MICIDRVQIKGSSYFQVTIQADAPRSNSGLFQDKIRFELHNIHDIRKQYEDDLYILRGLEIGEVLDINRILQHGRNIASIFPDQVQMSFTNAVHYARKHKKGLRIVIEVTPDAQELLAIPWELIVLPILRSDPTDIEGNDPLLLNADIHLVRQVQRVGRHTAPNFSSVLSIQAFVATPKHHPIDNKIIEACKHAISQVTLQDTAHHYWYHEKDTLQTLKARMLSEQPLIVHLLCHGESHSDIDIVPRNDLLFTHADGGVQRVSGYELAHALTLAPVQLVVLQACDSGVTALTKPPGQLNPQRERERAVIESVALVLVRHGIPAVVAMQGQVEQKAAGDFVAACYSALGEGLSLDQAVAYGRIAMSRPDNLIDWSIPVVYQGSGLPEQVPWHARFADGLVDAVGGSMPRRRAARACAAAFTILLLTIGLTRLLTAPQTEMLNPYRLLDMLWPWPVVGMVAPGAIVAVQRHEVDNEDPALRRGIRRAQVIGAYVGYMLSSFITAECIIFLWAVGLLSILPSYITSLLYYLLLSTNLLFSYGSSRHQSQSLHQLTKISSNRFSILISIFSVFSPFIPLLLFFFWLYIMRFPEAFAKKSLMLFGDPTTAAMTTSTLNLALLCLFNDSS